MHIKRRVALELDVHGETDQVEPEEWDLEDLLSAMAAGLARPLRTIHGMVLDTERDRLSETLRAISDSLQEVVEGFWISTSSPSIPRGTPDAGRPSLLLLVELEAVAEQARRVATHLNQSGL
jgi:hypothetical protein